MLVKDLKSISSEMSRLIISVFVAGLRDIDDPGYIEALEKETLILEKRVQACQSHVMIVTCFDGNSKSKSHSETSIV